MVSDFRVNRLDCLHGGKMSIIFGLAFLVFWMLAVGFAYLMFALVASAIIGVPTYNLFKIMEKRRNGDNRADSCRSQ